MKITVFSDNNKISDCFKNIVKSKSHSLILFATGDVKKELKNAEKDSLIYLDITGLETDGTEKIIRYIEKFESVLYGIIDPEGKFDNISGLFHRGASDYISKNEFKSGISAVRFKNIEKFHSRGAQTDNSEGKVKSGRDSFIDSETGWDNIASGKEYTFYFMFIELDNQKELLQKFGESSTKKLTKKFHENIEKIIAPLEGRIWMWNDFGGLILIPFNRRNNEPVLTCFRMMLYRKMKCIEDFNIDFLLSYRIILHIGNTVYKDRGETGDIISDSINFIHHISKRFASQGNFYLTENVVGFIPRTMKSFFLSDGEFEGRKITRMKKIIQPHSQ